MIRVIRGSISSFGEGIDERGKYFEEANLGNSLFALGGLFAVLLYYYQIEAYKGDLHTFQRLIDYEKFPGYLIANPGMELPDFPR